MEWREAAPWVMVGVTALGFVAQAAVINWRVGALDRWREDIEERLRTTDESRGKDEAQHDEIYRRLDWLEQMGLRHRDEWKPRGDG